MAHSFEHIPVLRDEVVSLFASVPPGVVVDATVGGGGHAAALLQAYDDLRIVGLDRDPAALDAARERLSAFGDRVTLMAAPFSTLESVLSRPGFGPLSGVLLDLGVSSPQLDWSERGFSFREDGPLDMRMDPTSGPTAADIVNSLPVRGPGCAVPRERRGPPVRAHRPCRRPSPATVLNEAAGRSRGVGGAGAGPPQGPPARRVFQALRIQVNDELGQLEAALPAALSHLEVGGVCAVISYHSGEDRLTKRLFADAATGGCVCPPGLPCVCGAVVRHQLVFRGARKASAAEIAANPRSESARLRAIVRTQPEAGAEAGPAGGAS